MLEQWYIATCDICAAESASYADGNDCREVMLECGWMFKGARCICGQCRKEGATIDEDR